LLESNYVFRLFFPPSSLIGLAATATTLFRIAMPQRIVIFVDAQFLTSFGPVGFAWFDDSGYIAWRRIHNGNSVEGDDRELKVFTAWMKQQYQNFEYETLIGEVWMENERTGQTSVSLGPLQCQFLLDGLRHEIARNQKV
jgi:hypothetical protein